MLPDYIYDNCEGGQVVRFGAYCYVVLLGNYFSELTSFCADELNGRLAWFDSTQEYETVVPETESIFEATDRNAFFYTGQSK